MRDEARKTILHALVALPSTSRTERIDCGTYHPLVPGVRCTRPLNHKGRHRGPQPATGDAPARVRWEQ